MKTTITRRAITNTKDNRTVIAAMVVIAVIAIITVIAVGPWRAGQGSSAHHSDASAPRLLVPMPKFFQPHVGTKHMLHVLHGGGVAHGKTKTPSLG